MSSRRDFIERFGAGISSRVLADAVRIATNVGIVLLLTRVWLQPEDFGTLFLVISIAGIAILTATLGIPKSAARFVTEYRANTPEAVPQAIIAAFLLLITASFLTGAALFITADLLSTLFNSGPELPSLIRLSVLYLLANSGYDFFKYTLQGLGEIRLTGILTAVFSAGQLGFLSLGYLLGGGLHSALLAMAGGYGLTVVLGLFFVSSTTQEFAKTKPWSSMLREIGEYSLPLTATKGSNILYKRVDTVMVGYFLSSASVGFYELAKQLAKALTQPASAIGFTVAPSLGESKVKKRQREGARTCEQTLAINLHIYVPVAIAVVVLAEPVVKVVFGAEYLGAAPVLQILSFFVFLQATDQMVNDALDYLGRARSRAIGKGATATGNFVLNLFLIPSFGTVGAAFSTVLMFGTMVSYNLYIIHQELGLNLRSIADDGILSAVSGGIVGLSALGLRKHVTDIPSLLIVSAAVIGSWSVFSLLTGVLRLQEIKEMLKTWS